MRDVNRAVPNAGRAWSGRKRAEFLFTVLARPGRNKRLLNSSNQGREFSLIVICNKVKVLVQFIANSQINKSPLKFFNHSSKLNKEIR